MTEESRYLISNGVLYLLGHSKRLMPIFVWNGTLCS